MFYLLQKSEFLHNVSHRSFKFFCFWEFAGDEIVSTDDSAESKVTICPQRFKKLLLFSGNDYLGLSSHPTIGKAAAKVRL